MGIQNKTKEEIHTLEIFPRTQMEEILQPQPNTGMGKNNLLTGDIKIGKGNGIHTKGVFPSIYERGQRKEFERETEDLSVLTLKRRGNSTHREIGRRIQRKHNRINAYRAGYVVQSNVYNSEASLEMAENSGCEFSEQGDINDSFQDEWNRSSERIDKERKLGNKFRSKISLSLPNSISTTQTIPSIRSNGESLLIQSNAVRNTALPIFFAQALAMVLTKIRRESDIKIMNYADDLLLLHQNKGRLREQTQTIMRILEAFRQTTAQEKCKTEPKQQINFLGWAWDLKRMYLKMIDLRKQELRYQLRRIISLTQRQIPIMIKYLVLIIGKLNYLRVKVREDSINIKLKDSAKTRALRNKVCGENMILPKKNPIRTLLVVKSDNEELIYDTRSENSKGSNNIRRMSEGLGE
ncbi:MAG: hypothetical protein EZS28_010015 [Streblomastix strix]|uniref:Reverse transcriptase domain-containing protein n=1 Tax=Streblomastix strix TaxID=222440 RepID=A0A5J4WIV9_9EUKA|nr:MAG: hypothetical protein EZS28_010015 [Streblomastix strix]